MDTTTGSTTDPLGTTDDGSETTGEVQPVACDVPGCWQECSQVIETMDMTYGECYSSTPDWTSAGCMTAELCQPLDQWDVSRDPMIFVEQAHCLLDALTAETPGHVDYSIYPDEYDNRYGTIYIVGDGTVLIDMNLAGHCGDGGSYSTRPIKTRNLDVIPSDQEPLVSCMASNDAQVLFDCLFGAWPISALSPDELPWLAGTCSMDPPMCPA